MVQNGPLFYLLVSPCLSSTDPLLSHSHVDMQSFEVQQNQISEGKCIVQSPSESVRKDLKKYTFATNDVFTLDIYMSGGEGKVCEAARS